MSTRLSLDTRATSLATLWMDLVSGSYKIAATLFTPEHSSLVLTAAGRTPGAKRPTLARKQVDILERALLGCPKKVIAFDFHLSHSSVTLALQQCFEFMGLSCRPSLVPLPLVIAAFASRAYDGRPRKRDEAAATSSREPLSGSAAHGEKFVHIPRPECGLTDLLSPAECSVVRLLTEGKSYVEMASLRVTSVRTIANQVASAFRRLGVSGRTELLCLLAQRALHPLTASGLDDAPRLQGSPGSASLSPISWS